MENPIKIFSIDKSITIYNPCSEQPNEEVNHIIVMMVFPNGAREALFKYLRILDKPVSKLETRFELETYAPHLAKHGNKYLVETVTIRKNSIDSHIEYRIDQFKKGYLTINHSTHNAYHRLLTYKQVKYMLDFERKSSRMHFMEKLPPAIEKGIPSLIDSGFSYANLDCGEYMIHSFLSGGWGLKHNYTCTTFNPEFAKWIDHVISTR